jgi:hypothetical protein
MEISYYDAQGNFNVVSDQYCRIADRDDRYAPVCVANGQGVPRVKGIYVNGVFNSRKEATHSLEEIAGVLLEHQPRADIDLELHYNDTFNQPWKVVNWLLGIMSLQKHSSGVELAKKIQESLRSGYGKVVLVAHSQGADIVGWAKQFLRPEELKRISIVSLGGKSQIQGAANLRHQSDLISDTAQVFLGGVSEGAENTILEGNRQDCETNFCHGFIDYSRHSKVQKTINHAFLPPNDPAHRMWHRLM